MPKQLYLLTRNLHLYIGLFLSPFLLVFAASVFFLVHSRSSQPAGSTRLASDLALPAGIERLHGREQVAALRPVLKQIGVQGEVNYIRSIPKEHRLVLPISLPGRETLVDLNLLQRTATVVESSTGLAGAVVHLHKMPGPHNANIRGNSTYMRVWRWLADIATYGLLFLTLSGIYLWAVLRAERRIGLALIGAGGISFFGLIYAIVH
ncbi:MAG: PepSY-associated TM helix domain-containing protein [Bryobacteraceae bacterium]